MRWRIAHLSSPVTRIGTAHAVILPADVYADQTLWEGCRTIPRSG